VCLSKEGDDRGEADARYEQHYTREGLGLDLGFGLGLRPPSMMRAKSRLPHGAIKSPALTFYQSEEEIKVRKGW